MAAPASPATNVPASIATSTGALASASNVAQYSALMPCAEICAMNESWNTQMGSGLPHMPNPNTA